MQIRMTKIASLNKEGKSSVGNTMVGDALSKPVAGYHFLLLLKGLRWIQTTVVSKIEPSTTIAGADIITTQNSKYILQYL